MKVQVVDSKALSSRSPQNIISYLQSKGWIGEPREDVARFTLNVLEDEFELLVPLSASARDYPARVRDIVRTLSTVEDRSELDIVRDLSTVGMDVSYVETFPVGPAGTAPLEDAVGAIQGLRDLVLGAATSVLSDKPRAVQPTRKPTAATELMHSVRVGPSIEGSYVLSAQLPVPPLLPSHAAERLFAAELEPLARRVTVMLHDALKEARDAAVQAQIGMDGFRGFTERVAKGVTANLCEALVSLGGKEGNPFRIRFAWALNRPMPRVSPAIEFGGDLLPVLASAAEELRARGVEDDVAVVGDVVRLHREGSGSGEVSVAGSIEGDDLGRLYRVWFELPANEYELAVRAHEQSATVVVRGDLIRVGNRYQLKNAHNFEVLVEAQH